VPLVFNLRDPFSYYDHRIVALRGSCRWWRGRFCFANVLIRDLAIAASSPTDESLPQQFGHRMQLLHMLRHDLNDDNDGNAEQHSPDAPQPTLEQQENEHRGRIHVGKDFLHHAAHGRVLITMSWAWRDFLFRD
jgi:hypothetical protein